MSPSAHLVVGANRGIGFGLVQETLKRYPDVTVFATARDPPNATELNALAKASAGRLIVVKAEMLDEAGLAEAAEEIRKHTPSLSRAFFNAAVMGGNSFLSGLSSADLLQTLNVNVVGPHNLFKAFSPLLLASKDEQRTIAVISSAAGSITLAKEMAAFVTTAFKSEQSPFGSYFTSKAALNMLGRQWAEVLEPQGVTVALVNPGAVKTDMSKGFEGPGQLTINECGVAVLGQLDSLKSETTATGMISYDGRVIPW